jgi:hypothetical protein
LELLLNVHDHHFDDSLQHVMRKFNQTYGNDRKVATGISQTMLNCLMLVP